MCEKDFKNHWIFYQKYFRRGNTSSNTTELIKLIFSDKRLIRFAALIDTNDFSWTTISSSDALEFNKMRIGLKVSHKKQSQFIYILKGFLEKLKIPIILLKSTAFNGYIYSDENPRGNSDIDILVTVNDEEKLNKVLKEFAILHKNEELHPFQELYERTWITNNHGGLYIDVHTSITNPKFYEVDHSKIFEQSIKHPSYNSKYIRVMSPEHNLIHCGLHILHDGYMPHHSLFDAGILYSSLTPSIEKTLCTAKIWGAERSTTNLLLELDKLLGSCISKDPRLVSFRLTVGRILFNKKLPEKSFRRRVQQIFLQLIFIDRTSRVLSTQWEFLMLKLKQYLTVRNPIKKSL
ncbi:MAG: nucleotidyltransferase family protein [Pseudoalteromonas sp.]|nr:nucleotidyltransferase family protein [Pseudoalteromonas sp.]